MSFAPPEAHQQFQVGHPSSHHNQKHAYLGKVVLGLETLRGYCGCGTPWEMGIGTNADNNPPSRLSHHFLPVLLSPLSPRLQHILRLLNTNVKGGGKIMFALTEIKGVGRRYANLVCKKADVDLNKRAGELNSDELERIVTIMQNPAQFKIPNWFLNRQKDLVDGKYSHVLSNQIDQKMRDDLERLKKIRSHRGLRHHWGLRVRGQHTKTTGRRGKTIAAKKK